MYLCHKEKDTLVQNNLKYSAFTRVISFYTNDKGMQNFLHSTSVKFYKYEYIPEFNISIQSHEVSARNKVTQKNCIIMRLDRFAF